MRTAGLGHGGGHTIASMSRRLFDRIDENRNGSASLQEFQRSGVLRKLGAVKTADEEKAAFESADTNKDGALSRIESQVFFQQLLSMSEKARIAAMLMMMQEDEADAAPEPPAPDAPPVEAPADAAPPATKLDETEAGDASTAAEAAARTAEAKLAAAYAEMVRRTDQALALAATHAVSA